MSISIRRSAAFVLLALLPACSGKFEVSDQLSGDFETSRPAEASAGSDTAVASASENSSVTPTSGPASEPSAPTSNPPLAANAAVTILRPLRNEIIDLTRTSLNLKLVSNVSGTVSVPVKILNAQGTLYQAELVTLVKGTNSINFPLNSQVRGHRGGFMMLKIGATSQSFGMGFLFLTAGQSNAGDSGCSKCASNSFTSDPRVVALQDPNWNDFANIATRVANGTISFGTANPGTERINVWIPLGKLLADTFDVPVGFIYTAQGGTTIAQWVETGGFKTRFAYGRHFDITSVLWHQGESDAGALVPTSGESYEASLRNLITEQMKSIPSPWLVSRASICDLTPVRVRRSHPAAQAIEAAQGRLVGQLLPLRVFAGPNTNEIAHACHFDFREEFDAYVRSWYDSILATQYLQSKYLQSQSSRVSVQDFGTPQLDSVFRFFNQVDKSRRYSRSSKPISSENFEGVAFKLADRRSAAYPQALYLCRQNTSGDYMVSRDAMCEADSDSSTPDYSAVELLGFGAASGAGSAELYRCTFSFENMPRHFATVMPQVECTPNGMIIEGSLGWVTIN